MLCHAMLQREGTEGIDAAHLHTPHSWCLVCVGASGFGHFLVIAWRRAFLRIWAGGVWQLAGSDTLCYWPGHRLDRGRQGLPWFRPGHSSKAPANALGAPLRRAFVGRVAGSVTLVASTCWYVPFVP